METVFAAAGGMSGLRQLAEAWHTRVMADAVVSHAFHGGAHPHHTDRLAAYWAEALGGPDAFTSRYGDESAVVRLHSGNGPHLEMDERAIACFDAALTDCGLTEDPLRACCTTTSPGRPPRRWRATPSRLTTYPTAWRCRAGRGTADSADPVGPPDQSTVARISRLAVPTDMPPSTRSTWPVTQAASAEPR